jgi:peptide/nickel transport system substrate-binding protein
VTSKPRHSPPRARLGLALLALTPILTLLGCGGDGEEGSEIATSQVAMPHLDPAYAYRPGLLRPVAANEPMSLVYVPLLAYRREEGPAGAELIAGLARDLPEVSEDGRTYLLTLREGLEYSDGATVRAGDFEHAIKRLLTAGSPAAAFFERVEGAEEYLNAGDPEGDIRGIRADDESGEITIELTEPDASFANALAMWFAAPVPRSTSFRNRSADPPPGVGPYEITEAAPGRRFVLEKSAPFPQLSLPDIPTGNVDTITVETVEDPEGRAEAVLEGELDYAVGPPTEEVRSMLLAEADERYHQQPALGTFLVHFDPTAAPFDDPRVREAVNHAIDRPALAALLGDGMEPGCSLLPPDAPGYEETLDTTECPYGDPAAGPDLERGRQLVEAAGASGARVTVGASGRSGLEDVAAAYAETLEAIGLDAETRSAGPGADAAPESPTEVQTGVTGVVMDFPHPLNLVSSLESDPAAPSPRELGDRGIERQLERLNLEPDLGSVEEEWAALDRYLVSPPQSYFAPFGRPRLTRVLSERLDLERARSHPVYLNDHLSFALAEAP